MPTWLNGLFATIDQMDPDGFAAFLTDEASFRFGSAPAVRGKDDVRQAIADG